MAFGKPLGELLEASIQEVSNLVKPKKLSDVIPGIHDIFIGFIWRRLNSSVKVCL